MQIKEFQAETLKECLQKVREAMGGDAVILETRKVRKGGVLGWGMKEAVLVVAATGVTVQSDAARKPEPRVPQREAALVGSNRKDGHTPAFAEATRQKSAEMLTAVRKEKSPAVSSAMARNTYAAQQETNSSRSHTPAHSNVLERSASLTSQLVSQEAHDPDAVRLARLQNAISQIAQTSETETSPAPRPTSFSSSKETQQEIREADRIAGLEKALYEIREGLTALRHQQEKQEKAVTAVVQTVSPSHSGTYAKVKAQTPAEESGFPALYELLLDTGVSPELTRELLDELPSMDAWSEEAREHLSRSALRDVIARRVPAAGGIRLTPGRTKAIALIGPTGVGKTTTIAKLAAHFSLVERKRVALITVDTYRIAAVEQLKNYAQIIDIPIGVAYDSTEIPAALQQFADFDLVLIDTAGRSQKNIAQVGELKEMLSAVSCETHLVMSAHMKEKDMLEAIQRFSGARVDHVIFSKLDETNSYGTLLNVLDKAGVPVSYLTTGQKVPEDIETADGKRLAEMILG